MEFKGCVAINGSEVCGVEKIKVVAKQVLTPISDYCASEVLGYDKCKKEFLICIECECGGVDEVDFTELVEFNLIIKNDKNVAAYEACEWEEIETVFENSATKKKHLIIRSPKKFVWEEDENGRN